MSTQASPPFLPPDVLFHIIDCLFLPTAVSPIAYPPWHPVTRTLLSLTRTCRLTYSLALRLLYTKCLHIDSPHRLRCLLNALTEFPASTCEPVLASSRTLPQVPLLHHITSLYLSPYPNWNIADLTIARSLKPVLCSLAPTLHRLVVDIPLRSVHPPDDNLHLRPILRHTFSQLVELELFCSVSDELYLDCQDGLANIDEPYVWSLWPKLKTLALYNADVDSKRFWQGLGRLRQLETLVLTRADGLEDVDLKREWRRHCGDEKRGMDIFLVNVQNEHRLLMGKEDWKKEDIVVIKEVNVPTSYYGDEDAISLCQGWVKRRMLSDEVAPGLTWWD